MPNSSKEYCDLLKSALPEDFDYVSCVTGTAMFLAILIKWGGCGFQEHNRSLEPEEVAKCLEVWEECTRAARNLFAS